MKRLAIPTLAVCLLALLPARLLAEGTNQDVTVQVNLVPLKKGRLPTSITTYGRVMPAEKSRTVIAAPIAAQVSDVDIRPGQAIEKGAPIIILAPSPQSRATYNQAKLSLVTAKKLLSRSRSLAKAHLETSAQLVQDEKSAADAMLTLKALEEEGAGGPNTIMSPFSAVVMNVNVSAGTFVTQGEPLVTLARPGDLVLRTGVVPAEASRIRPGDKVTITPFSGSGTFQGKVILRGSVVSQANGLAPIDVSVPGKSLMTGEMAKAVIDTGIVQGYLVPHDAILLDESGQTYIVQSVDLTAHKVLVTLLASKDGLDIIKGDVIAGAPVVGAGNYQLENGMKMRIAHPLSKAGQ